MITDGTYKLDLILLKFNSDVSKIEKGTKLEITGDIQENGIIYIYL